MPAAVKVFYSYAPADKAWLVQFEKYLAPLEQAELMVGWHAGKIVPGMDELHEIAAHIQAAHVVLLLISPDFMSYERCCKVEVPRIMQRLRAGEAHVIPILIRPIDWKGAPFGNLLPLPKNGIFISRWPNTDEGFADVAQDIRTVVETLREKSLTDPPKTPTTSSTAQETISSQVWNIPFRRNPYFTGRENVLESLHNILATNTAAALSQPQAISGLGGVGKTQTAIEYAYRYRNEYQYILWVKADTLQTLFSDLVTLASLLKLREKDVQDQNMVVNAVKGWLESNTQWLLIFDNADDLKMAHEFLPSQGKGHILLTTRAYSMGGIAQRVEIEEMEPEQGALFLLRRAGIIGKDAPLSDALQVDSAKAKAISETMDGLPLALDQAGAFIEETGCSLADYLTMYEKQRTELLKKGGGIAAPHPEPVATTWSLSFEKVEKANPAAGDLLRFFAFLHPDAIPEELITKGAAKLGAELEAVANDAVKLNRAIGELFKYSLVRRDARAKTLSVHRLVQAVMKDRMEKDEQRVWTERTVRAVNRAFPFTEFENWDLCKRLLPHAQVCAELMRDWDMEFEEAGRLLNQTGLYLNEHARYEEAELFYRRAIEIGEKTSGAEHPTVAIRLNNLANLYLDQGKYEEAEALYQRALEIGEKTIGGEHPDIAVWYNNLAILYNERGKYEEAEALYRRAIKIKEKVFGANHPNVAINLENYAGLLRRTNREAEATELELRARAIRARYGQGKSGEL